jgi:hypothetical protein
LKTVVSSGIRKTPTAEWEEKGMGVSDLGPCT